MFAAKAYESLTKNKKSSLGSDAEVELVPLQRIIEKIPGLQVMADYCRKLLGIGFLT